MKISEVAAAVFGEVPFVAVRTALTGAGLSPLDLAAHRKPAASGQRDALSVRSPLPEGRGARPAQRAITSMQQLELDAAVLLLAGLGLVVGDRLVGAGASRLDAIRGDALRR